MPDAKFSEACHQVTAGNPLLLGQLLSALSTEGVSPETGSVGAVREIGREPWRARSRCG